VGGERGGVWRGRTTVSNKGIVNRIGGGIQPVRGKGDDGYVGVVDVNATAADAVAAANNDNVSVNRDHRNDNGTTVTVAVGEADATIVMTTAEGGDDAPAPVPLSTHPSWAVPMTTSDNDDDKQGGRLWHNDDDDVDNERGGGQQCGVLGNIVQMHCCRQRQRKIRSSGGDGRRWRLHRPVLSDSPPPFRRLPEEQGRRQQRR
jgi:hypothetical protein